MDSVTVSLRRARYEKLLDIVRERTSERERIAGTREDDWVPTLAALDAAEILADLERAGRTPLRVA